MSDKNEQRGGANDGLCGWLQRNAEHFAGGKSVALPGTIEHVVELMQAHDWTLEQALDELLGRALETKQIVAAESGQLTKL